MKTLLKTSIIVLIMFTAYSCNKDKTINQTTISGKIVTDCAGTPMANQKLELYAQGNRALGKGGGTYQFTTDSEGNFSVKNENPVEGEEVRIQYSGGGMDLIILTGSEDENIGTLNTNPSVNYQIKLIVNNPYNVGDTIRFTKSGLETYKLPCPIDDTTMEINNNYVNPFGTKLEDINKTSVGVFYEIYSGTRGSSSYLLKKHETYTHKLIGCNSQVNQIELIVE